MTYDEELYYRGNLSDLGSVPEGGTGVSYKKETFTGNGATVAFNLSQTPASFAPPFVYLSGVRQNSPEVYIQVGTLIDFLIAPANGIPITVIYCY